MFPVNNTINATLETAAKVNSPVILQFSNGGAQFNAGKGMPNDHLQANISGGITGALACTRSREILWSTCDITHRSCGKKMVPWVSALIDAGEKYYKEKKQPCTAHTCLII